MFFRADRRFRAKGKRRCRFGDQGPEDGGDVSKRYIPIDTATSQIFVFSLKITLGIIVRRLPLGKDRAGRDDRMKEGRELTPGQERERRNLPRGRHLCVPSSLYGSSPLYCSPWSLVGPHPRLYPSLH